MDAWAMIRKTNSTRKPLRELSQISRRISDRLLAIADNSARSLFELIHAELLSRTARDVDAPQLADTLAQTLVLARIAWRQASPELHAVAPQLATIPVSSQSLKQLLSYTVGVASTSQAWSLGEDVDDLLQAADHVLSLQAGHPIDFDSFLQAHDPRGRNRHGVYFTPAPIARYIVRQIDQLLREEFAVTGGLATHAAPNTVEILDPAAGAGVFLHEVVDCVEERFKAENTGPNRRDKWNEFVANYLLPRLRGSDLLLPACAVAWLRLADHLAKSGYDFRSAAPIQIDLRDSLLAPSTDTPDAKATGDHDSVPSIAAILGNPPFSALTTSSNAWIDRLLKLRELNGRPVGSFYEADGEPLSERKLWLHDDYVKFLRFAQWKVEQSKSGIVGFVTSHGYLDNLTFRGVRQSLLRSFPKVSIIDLHGGRKKRERAPDGQVDENVFGIDQGVAIGLFRKPPNCEAAAVARADLWGHRDAKLASLKDPARIAWKVIAPQSPHYLFAAGPKIGFHQDYTRGDSLHEIMPVHSSAAVTARDSFVIAPTPHELIERMRNLADPTQSDEVLRNCFFSRTRSRRYPKGDSRGWKLTAARRRAQQVTDWDSLVRQCLYRPFDWRYVLWADWMVDWPRHDVMQHMLDGNNLALVTRRQMIADEPPSYFYVSDRIVIDGLIRSDNRGSESFFPLFLQRPDHPAVERTANFEPEFLQRAAAILELGNTPDPAAIFAMIYALVHSTVYRERYHHELCFGFPKVFLPRRRDVFLQLARSGRRLIDAHLLRTTIVPDSIAIPNGSITEIPSRGWPQYRDSTIWITEEVRIPDVEASVWDYRIGGYQVCQKWLRDRTGQPFRQADLSQYQRIVTAIRTSLAEIRLIDQTIATNGGWLGCFGG